MNSIGKRPRPSVPRRSEVRRHPAKPIGPLARWNGKPSRTNRAEERRWLRRTYARCPREAPRKAPQPISLNPPGNRRLALNIDQLSLIGNRTAEGVLRVSSKLQAGQNDQAAIGRCSRLRIDVGSCVRSELPACSAAGRRASVSWRARLHNDNDDGRADHRPHDHNHQGRGR